MLRRPDLQSSSEDIIWIGLTDLIVEFDEMYLHSLSDSHDLRYLTDKSKFQRC